MEVFHKIVILIILTFWIKSTQNYRFEPNTLTLKSFSECPGVENTVVHANYTYKRIARNKYIASGLISFDEHLGGLMEVQIISQRCDFNNTACEIFDTLNIRDVCRIFDMQDQLWTNFFEHTEPRLRCPMKEKYIRIIESVVDLGYIAHFPLSGYTWTFTFKAFKTNVKKQQRKRLLMCITYDVTITKARPERKRKGTSEQLVKIRSL